MKKQPANFAKTKFDSQIFQVDKKTNIRFFGIFGLYYFLLMLQKLVQKLNFLLAIFHVYLQIIGAYIVGQRDGRKEV